MFDRLRATLTGLMGLLLMQATPGDPPCPSNHSEMTGGCEVALVVTAPNTPFQYILKQTDTDWGPLGVCMSLIDQTCKIKPIDIRSIESGLQYYMLSVASDGTYRWGVVGTSIHSDKNVIVIDQWELSNNRGPGDPYLDNPLTVGQAVQIQVPPPNNPPGGSP